MVVVAMGKEHGGNGEMVLFDDREQFRVEASRIDENGVSSFVRAEEIGGRPAWRCEVEEEFHRSSPASK
jgi:hypothetical protein